MKQELKHTELRCGNLVYNPYLNEIRTVDYLDIRDHAEKILYTPFEGIELTDEWLHNFGFDIEWTIGGFLKWEKQMPYEEKFKLLDRRLPHPQYHEPQATILYVHQLQNLFFALTGRELELKK